MQTPLLEMEGTGAEVALRLSDYANQRVHIIVLPPQREAETAQTTADLAAAYREMAADEERETDALAWSEGTLEDVADAAR